MNESLSREEKLKIAEEAEQKFKLARQLYAERKYEEALECYLFAFDNGHHVSAWGGVRLSYIPGEIARLGDEYAPAKAALQVRRDEREALIANGECDFGLFQEWTSLNGYLKERDRQLDVFNRLKTEKKLTPDLKRLFVGAHPDYFMKLDPKVLKDQINDMGSSLWMTIYRYETSLLFHPFPFEPQRNDHIIEANRSSVIRKTVKLYDLLLEDSQFNAADAVENKVLSLIVDRELFKDLIMSARRSAPKERADRLLAQAKNTLPKIDFDWLEKTLSEL